MAVRQSFAAMGKEAKRRLIEAVADLGEEAIKFAFNQGYKGSLSARRQFIGYDIVTRKPVWAWMEPRPDKGNGWYSRRGNLHDSFGSAVYVDGVLQSGTIRYVDEETWAKSSDPRFGFGRRALNEYFNRIHPKNKKNEVMLVVVAAMPYTKFLEKGSHAGGYRIRVISGARAYIDKNWHKVEDKVYKHLGLKKPASRVIKGDMMLLKDL